MHVFVDESEWPRPKAPNGFTVWAAIALHPAKGRQFFRDVFNLEKKFWKVEEPYEFEIKGRAAPERRGNDQPEEAGVLRGDRQFVQTERKAICRSSIAPARKPASQAAR